MASQVAGPEFGCRECGESFSEDVWHCRHCDHHWPKDREDCWNCHEGTQEEAAA